LTEIVSRSARAGAAGENFEIADLEILGFILPEQHLK